MDIYVKAYKKVSIYNRASIKIKDVSEIFAPKDILSKIESITLKHIDSDTPQNVLISVIDIIKLIDKNFPGNTVNSVGEIETLVHFERKEKPLKKSVQWLKVVIICLVLLAGSSTAIMSFHTDAQIPAVFKNYYYIFFGKTSRNMHLIDIPYSIGLAVGIIVFFNHFTFKKSLEDPTPIDVEMTIYEDEIIKTMVDKMSISETNIGKKSET